MTAAGYEGPEGRSEGISGPVWRVDSRVDSGSFLRHSGTLSGPYLRNLIIFLKLALIWPWVGPLVLNMVNMGPGRVLPGYRYSPSQYPPTSQTPGTPPPARRDWPARLTLVPARLNSVVGL